MNILYVHFFILKNMTARLRTGMHGPEPIGPRTMRSVDSWLLSILTNTHFKDPDC